MTVKPTKKALCVISNLPVNIKRKMILDLMKGGQIFSVTWITKSGKISTMNARAGVTKYLKKDAKPGKNGSTNTVAHLKQYATVYKTNQGYRNLDLDTVLTLKAKGNVLHFSG